MAKRVEQLGLLFPAGGRVAPEQMIGREGDVEDLVVRLREHSHLVLSGPRRAGKTSVCGAACARLRDEGFLTIEVEAPEQSSAEGFCQLMIDRCARLDLDRISKGLLKGAVPVVQALLAEQGVPLDLSSFAADVPDPARRAALALPLAIARQQNSRVVLFIDELQRATGYADGIALARDLVDLYAGNTDVVLLIDGSEERTIDQLMGAPYDLARLCQRRALDPTIPLDSWSAPLDERFRAAGLTVGDEHLDQILEFGGGRPYDTMMGCLYVGLNARRVEADAIDDFVLANGLEEARQRLDEDT
jgi:DNA polymerase III delta prime subunit